MSRSKYDLERPENYDALVPLVIPRWELFYETVADYIPPHSRRVLELGSGTGILTEMISKMVSGCDIVCLDSNPEMLAVAKKKPALRAVTLIEGDIMEKWPKGPFDAVVTTQCLFSFSESERAHIIAESYRHLSDGGVFVNGDVFHPGDPWEFTFYCDRLRGFMCENGLSEEVAGMMLAPLEPLVRDYTPSSLCSLLRTEGYIHTAIPYRCELYGIVLGLRR
jgi:tRNA (cmo5U34)-methyltransferase